MGVGVGVGQEDRLDWRRTTPHTVVSKPSSPPSSPPSPLRRPPPSQVAEQDAERARFVVLKAEQERNAAIIRAEGESEAAKLISDATKVRFFGVPLFCGGRFPLLFWALWWCPAACHVVL